MIFFFSSILFYMWNIARKEKNKMENTDYDFRYQELKTRYLKKLYECNKYKNRIKVLNNEIDYLNQLIEKMKKA